MDHKNENSTTFHNTMKQPYEKKMAVFLNLMIRASFDHVISQIFLRLSSARVLSKKSYDTIYLDGACLDCGNQSHVLK